MKTPNLIEDLVNDLTPVRRLPTFSRRFLLWFTGAALSVVAVLAVTGVRVDVPANFSNLFYVTESAVLLALAAIAAGGALRESVPGNAPWPRWVVPSFLGLWAIMSLLRLGTALSRFGISALIPDLHVACAVITLLMSVLAGVPLFVLLRRAAPLEPGWNGALAGLASGATAMVAVQLYCVYRTPAHIVAWHILPMFAAVGLGAFLGWRALKRQ